MCDRKVRSGGPIFTIQTYQDRLAKQEISQKNVESLRSNEENKTTSAPPPPPPPMPSAADNHNHLIVEKEHNLDKSIEKSKSTPNKIKPKAPPVPVKYSTLSHSQTNSSPKVNNNSTYNNAPEYYCPTPDYDTISIASSTTSSSTFRQSQNNDSVEMESLESFRLDGNNTTPKPPNTYFKKNLSGQLSNGSTANNSINGTLKKPRPISVTIGEYPTMRRQQPGKLDFLNQNGHTDDNCKKHNSVTSQFASELAQTLSRSNLRKRTESVENLLQNSSGASSNGSIRISLNPNLSKNMAKSTNDLSSIGNPQKDLYRTTSNNTYNNRVTININNGTENNYYERKNESPNGILKNTVNGNSNLVSANHKPLSQQKSITFGRL